MPCAILEGVYEEMRKSHSDKQILIFISVLCFICALILSVTAFSLAKTQQIAKDYDQSKQMLIAVKILSPKGYFELFEPNGNTIKAYFDSEKKILIPDSNAPKAKEEQIKKIAELRIRPLLTNQVGNVYTLEEKGIHLQSYLAENKKKGYASQPLKLFYAILPNGKEAAEMSAAMICKNLKLATAFVIPISGFGLWAPIYGYLALAPDGNTVIGTTWYEHGETPGLGANITEAWWQKQFFGKMIFQKSAGGEIDLHTADMGIIVVKGKVKDVFGNSPKIKNAVDGMSGATLTGVGVTDAYRNSLLPYREFLIRLAEKNE
jgi:Na+-transporting NADH:ubiquinone oxidoreductase subunit C